MPDLLEDLRDTFQNAADFKEQGVAAGGDGPKLRLLWLESLISGRDLGEELLRPLLDPKRFGGLSDGAEVLRQLLQGGVDVPDGTLRKTSREIAGDLLDGRCALVFRELNLAVTYELRSGERRGVEAPREEKVLLGGKDAFTETLRTNLGLVRRRLPSPGLMVEEVKTRCQCPTKVQLLWMDGVADPLRVTECRRRLSRIEADALLSASILQSALSDRPGSVFPQVLSTERSDRFALNLLEGRGGVLVDGLPLGWLAPAPLSQFFRVPEDEALHPWVGSALTMLRYLALLVGLALPALFVAISMYHQEMLPARLMEAIIEAKRSVPFPSGVETVVMLLAVELLQEAGLRLATPVGETVTVLGALLVGQAAIEAKLVSPVVVIVVSLATVAGYTSPSQEMAGALRLLRMLLVLAAAGWGMLGLSAGAILLVHYLCGIEVLGVPYLEPFSSGSLKKALGGLLRRPGDAAHRRDDSVAGSS